jgi:endonuclease/exonuclease/phosphatase family metal-dependent hydrolase
VRWQHIAYQTDYLFLGTSLSACLVSAQVGDGKAWEVSDHLPLIAEVLVEA